MVKQVLMGVIAADRFTLESEKPAKATRRRSRRR
jgi:hypothetical protein